MRLVPRHILRAAAQRAFASGAASVGRVPRTKARQDASVGNRHRIRLSCRHRASFNLDSSVGRAGVCGFPGTGHTRRPYGLGTRGATLLHGHSIPFSFLRSCNAAMRPENRAIQPVAFSSKRVHAKHMIKPFRTNMLHILASGQQRNLGLSRHCQRRNLVFNTLVHLALGSFQVVLCLQVHPECGFGAEQAG